MGKKGAIVDLDPKLEARRARDREAARRSRKRKKDLIDTLSEEVSRLTLENKSLRQKLNVDGEEDVPGHCQAPHTGRINKAVVELIETLPTLDDVQIHCWIITQNSIYCRKMDGEVVEAFSSMPDEVKLMLQDLIDTTGLSAEQRRGLATMAFKNKETFETLTPIIQRMRDLTGEMQSLERLYQEKWAKIWEGLQSTCGKFSDDVHFQFRSWVNKEYDKLQRIVLGRVVARSPSVGVSMANDSDTSDDDDTSLENAGSKRRDHIHLIHDTGCPVEREQRHKAMTALLAEKEKEKQALVRASSASSFDVSGSSTTSSGTNHTPIAPRPLPRIAPAPTPSLSPPSNPNPTTVTSTSTAITPTPPPAPSPSPVVFTQMPMLMQTPTGPIIVNVMVPQFMQQQQQQSASATGQSPGGAVINTQALSQMLAQSSYGTSWGGAEPPINSLMSQNFMMGGMATMTPSSSSASAFPNQVQQQTAASTTMGIPNPVLPNISMSSGGGVTSMGSTTSLFTGGVPTLGTSTLYMGAGAPASLGGMQDLNLQNFGTGASSSLGVGGNAYVMGTGAFGMGSVTPTSTVGLQQQPTLGSSYGSYTFTTESYSDRPVTSPKTDTSSSSPPLNEMMTHDPSIVLSPHSNTPPQFIDIHNTDTFVMDPSALLEESSKGHSTFSELAASITHLPSSSLSEILMSSFSAASAASASEGGGLQRSQLSGLMTLEDLSAWISQS